MAIYENGKIWAEGCCIRTWEHNNYDDSDFYVDYLNIEDGTIVSFEYSSTRYNGGARVKCDLTRDNIIKWWAKARQLHINKCIERDLIYAKKVNKGKTVKVIKGRKVPLGIIGEVFWEQQVNYSPYKRGCDDVIKIGIKDAAGNVYWTYSHNCEVVDPSKYCRDIQDIIGYLDGHYNDIINGHCKFDFAY